MQLSAGDQIGPYEIVGLLGTGAMGEVYRARDTNLGRMAAIKVLADSTPEDSERRSRFRNEAKVLAALNHPNIAAVYGWEDLGESSALVMELIDGGPLNQSIPRNGMPLAKALECAIQVARGLEAAHRAGIVHRDLKPANVMVTSGGVVKLVDFGIARHSPAGPLGGSADETPTASIQPTSEGAIVGTIDYMSPEQAQGKPIDARSDLFSFGILFFEMLTGKRPFSGEDQLSTLCAILREEPPVVSSFASVPKEVDRVVARCLRKSADRRFQTASDLRVALEELAEEASTGNLPAVSALRSRSFIPWIVAAVAAATAAVTGSQYFTRRQPPSASGEFRQLTSESGMAVMPALSRDGKLLAYASDRAGQGALDLWIRQTEGGDSHRLTSSTVVSNPQFSPDGTRVLFLSGSSIFEIPALGGPTRRLIENAGPFTVSALGEIAFVTPRTAVNQPIMIVPAAGGPPQELRADCKTGSAPGWSPDGQRLAFVGFCGDDFGIFVVPRQGGKAFKVPVKDVERSGNRFRQSNRVYWHPAIGGSTETLILPVRDADTVNLFRVAMTGAMSPITQGTGHQTEASVSADGTIVFTRAEYHPAVWSMPIDASIKTPAPPKKEAAPATLFAVSQDGAKLVYGRNVGLTKGEFLARDLTSGTESVIASHESAGFGNFWSQFSPDATQVVYRLSFGPTDISQCLISMGGGAPHCQETRARFNVASGWRPDGARIIGECEQGAICEMNPADWSIRQIVAKPPGMELLFPSYSWDGRWMTFMQRANGVTAITISRVRNDGSLAPQSEWVRISPEEIRAAARPRFTQDGKLIFYIRNEGGVQHLMRQPVDLVLGRSLEQPVAIAPLQIYAGWFADTIGVPSSYIQLSKTRVFFNSVEFHSNIWMTPLH